MAWKEYPPLYLPNPQKNSDLITSLEAILPNSSVIIWPSESHIFWDSCKGRFVESRNQQYHAYY